MASGAKLFLPLLDNRCLVVSLLTARKDCIICVVVKKAFDGGMEMIWCNKKCFVGLLCLSAVKSAEILQNESRDEEILDWDGSGDLHTV